MRRLQGIFSVVLIAASSANAKTVHCFLQVDGTVYIDKPCEFTPDAYVLPGDHKGGFEIGTGTGERFLARDEAAHDRAYGYFAFVSPNGDGTAGAYQNGEY